MKKKTSPISQDLFLRQELIVIIIIKVLCDSRAGVISLI